MSQGICRMTVRVLRVQDARCESGTCIWTMAVRVLKAEDARCGSGYLEGDSQGAERRGC